MDLIDEKNIVFNLGDKLKKIREGKSLSQEDIAGGEMDARNIRRIENKERSPKIETLLPVLENLNTTFEKLFCASAINDCFYREDIFEFATNVVLQNKYDKLVEIADKLALAFSVDFHNNNDLKVFQYLYLVNQKQKNQKLNIAEQAKLLRLLESITITNDNFVSSVDAKIIALFFNSDFELSEKEEMLGQIKANKNFYLHPVIAYNICIFLTNKNKWTDIYELARGAVAEITHNNMYIYVLPSLLAMQGYATFQLGNVAEGIRLFEKGITQSVLFKQKNVYHALVKQAKKIIY